MLKKIFGKLRAAKASIEAHDIRIYGIVSFLGIIKFVFWLWVSIAALWLVLYTASALFA